MTISRREGPFVAEITGDLLSVHRCQTDEAWGAGALTGSGVSMLFFCPLRKMPWFVIHGDGLYAQNAHDALTPLYRGGDAAQLLACITRLLTTAESKRLRRRVKGIVVGTVAVGILAWIVFAKSLSVSPLWTPPEAALLTTVDAPEELYSVQKPVPTQLPVTAMKPPVRSPESSSAPLPADRWSLPLNARVALEKAASRGLFTVPLSSGHARTLYVFADPECANCQRLERHFEAAAGTVNVVIFPVTIEGGKSSLDALTPVMVLPENGRAAAWKKLFAVDAGIGVPGGGQALPAVTHETQAETARGAIGVNEVAFRAYRLPGTPWTISDDGRYVPQSVLSSPAALEEFLNEGGHDGQ